MRVPPADDRRTTADRRRLTRSGRRAGDPHRHWWREALRVAVFYIAVVGFRGTWRWLRRLVTTFKHS